MSRVRSGITTEKTAVVEENLSVYEGYWSSKKQGAGKKNIFGHLVLRK